MDKYFPDDIIFICENKSTIVQSGTWLNFNNNIEGKNSPSKLYKTVQYLYKVQK